MSVPKVECVGIADNYGRFKIAPLETGYGLTLGNALRRILLSSLEGAAVTAVQIDGVYHEFSSLPGVKEDVTDIVLNLKRLRLRSYSDRPVTLRLEATGPKQVTAADIRPNAEVDVVSLDLPLATLDSEDARLQIELTVDRGRGYVPAEAQDGLPIGMIAVDAVYSPVTKVNYVVERTRIGQKTDYDQLVLEVWTDGAIAPGDALSQAARILMEQSQVIAAYAQGETDFGDAAPLGVFAPAETDSRSIDELGLSARTLNCLRRAGILSVGQVLTKTKRDLLSIRNFGDKSLVELQEKLQEFEYMSPSAPDDYLLSADDAVPLGVLTNRSAEAAGDDLETAAAGEPGDAGPGADDESLAAVGAEAQNEPSAAGNGAGAELDQEYAEK
jgi:DNA-directed RNA polymerase subunit alpha